MEKAAAIFEKAAKDKKKEDCLKAFRKVVDQAEPLYKELLRLTKKPKEVVDKANFKVKPEIEKLLAKFPKDVPIEQRNTLF
jgi:hypothetical protein